MAVSQQQIRDYVRDYMLLPDLSDTMLDSLMRDGCSQVQRYADWPWQHKVAQMTVQRTGNVDEIGTFIADARRIFSVSIPEWGALVAISWQEAAAIWPDNYGASSDIPAYYTALGTMNGSTGGVAVRIWPRADSNLEDVTVRYLVGGETWPAADEIGQDTTDAATNTPPLPEPFHQAVQRWALAEVMGREGQHNDQRVELGKFEAELEAAKAQWADVRADPVVVNGGADISVINAGYLGSVGVRRRIGLA